MHASLRRKSLVALLAMVVALGSLALLGCSGDNASSEGANLGSGTPVDANTIEIAVTIDISDAIAENDPTALELEKTQGANYTTQVKVPEGATVMEALEAADVDIATTSSSYGPYVSGINGLVAGSVGPESGWTFYINDEFSMESVDDAKLSAGDTVLWQFVTTYE